MKKYYKYIIPFASHLKRITSGWGCGYVAIYKTHSLFGKDYIDDKVKNLINIHGGLTYSNRADLARKEIGTTKQCIPEKIINSKDYWIFGFDTRYYQDNCNQKFVEKETNKLLKQLKQYE